MRAVECGAPSKIPKDETLGIPRALEILDSAPLGSSTSLVGGRLGYASEAV